MLSIEERRIVVLGLQEALEMVFILVDVTVRGDLSQEEASPWPLRCLAPDADSTLASYYASQQSAHRRSGPRAWSINAAKDQSRALLGCSVRALALLVLLMRSKA